MNIVFYLGSMNNGGAERVIANLSNHLCRDNQILILTSVRKKTVYELDQSVQIKALDDQEVPSGNILKRNIDRIRSLIKEIKRFNANILIAFLSEPCFRSLLIKKKIRIPVIISQRNDPNKEYESLLYKCLMKWLFPRADGIVFQTHEQKAYFPKIIQEKSVVIANPVSDEFISMEYEYPMSRKIISVGRLDAQKNFPLLVEAFTEFAISNSDYSLYIYGEGPERKKLEAFIRERGMENKIFLPGRAMNIKEKLLESEFFVMSSDFEGMPNALIEAMCLGIPVIATDCPCGGPAELITENEMGILVNVGDKNGLVKAMHTYTEARHVAMRYGKRGRDVLKKVKPSNVARQWENYILSIAKEHRNQESI